MSLTLNTKMRALVSPRLVRREILSSDSDDENKSETDLKSGDIVILSQDDEKIGYGQKAHMELVKDNMHMNMHAKFYTDSNKTFRFGSLDVEKCKISLSTTDLSIITVSKCDDKNIPAPGLLIKAKSQEEAMQWMEVMTR